MFPFLDKSIKLHAPPHDAQLIGLDGVTKYSLVDDFVKKMPTGVPIIINFGSYNWGLFMAKLDRMAIIQEKYCSGAKPLAKFLTIYIEECKRNYC